MRFSRHALSRRHRAERCHGSRGRGHLRTDLDHGPERSDADDAAAHGYDAADDGADDAAAAYDQPCPVAPRQSGGFGHDVLLQQDGGDLKALLDLLVKPCVRASGRLRETWRRWRRVSSRSGRRDAGASQGRLDAPGCEHKAPEGRVEN